MVAGSPSRVTLYVSGSTAIFGSASLRTMCCLPIERHRRTGSTRLSSPSSAGTPRSTAAWDMKETRVACRARPYAPNIGR